jgi:hypothetical protein
MRTTASIIIIASLALAPAARAADADPDKAAGRGLEALLKTQQEDGHWGSSYPVAITSMAGLAILAQDENGLDRPQLAKAWRWLEARQKEGDFLGPQWLHEQGYATLFASELYGKLLVAKSPPKGIDREKVRDVLVAAVRQIENAQSDTGGWYYTRAKGTSNDEGSTTVCAVQALRSAKNFGIKLDDAVLARGFDYLKRMQNPDGGFRYQACAGASMVAGSAGSVASLVLMSKLDHAVLFRAVKFLEHVGVEGLAGQGEYALFYAAMACEVLNEEFGKHMEFAGASRPAIARTIAARQQADGSWPQTTDTDYSTALSVLTLAVPRGRLSVFHRDAPKLPG